MLNKTKKANGGFTIIEVMIVLAIAGLILLIVFLAVPALQRNSRNTQRKNDVSALLSAVSEYESNSNGQLPNTSGTFQSTFTNANPKLGYYTTAANVTYNYKSSNTTPPSDPNDLDKVVIQNYAVCNAANTAAVGGAAASARSVVAVYDVETSGGLAEQCVSS